MDNTILLIALLIPFSVAVWLYSDAIGRGKDNLVAAGWAIFTFALLIIALPAWLTLRPKIANSRVDGAFPERVAKQCVSCSKYYDGDPSFCPNCGIALKTET